MQCLPGRTWQVPFCAFGDFRFPASFPMCTCIPNAYAWHLPAHLPGPAEFITTRTFVQAH